MDFLFVIAQSSSGSLTHSISCASLSPSLAVHGSAYGFDVYTVGSKTVAMFEGFGLSAMQRLI